MFKGILTPVITVLDQKGRLDFPGNELVINRLINHGMNGLLFLGSIGEFTALTMEEKKEFIRYVVKIVSKRVPVLIGTGGTVQEEAIELTQVAEQEGADGVVVISPYYFKLTPEIIYRYYANIARNTALPMMLYNFPERTSSDLGPDLVTRLAADFTNIVAIKDTVDNISHTRKLIQAVKQQRPEFTILSGFDEYLLPNLMAGGDGVLCGLTNVVPEVFSELLKAYETKDFGKVARLNKKVSILMNLYDVSQPFIGAIKGAVAARGVAINPTVKEPAMELTEWQCAEIDKILMMAEQV
ncbi:dihydrodipicolinate synthase family protein [Sporomusaceae bacterium FL31]|nr:dihydrodipicolinate synthase family protein [Sporomusaceae bacterium FL31]GCE33158.1 dihydrodipicolinate synthase family protein [Sporomusaceae bacterium]